MTVKRPVSCLPLATVRADPDSSGLVLSASRRGSLVPAGFDGFFLSDPTLPRLPQLLSAVNMTELQREHFNPDSECSK